MATSPPFTTLGPADIERQAIIALVEELRDRQLESAKAARSHLNYTMEHFWNTRAEALSASLAEIRQRGQR